jgi:hypothetical protein
MDKEVANRIRNKETMAECWRLLEGRALECTAEP